MVSPFLFFADERMALAELTAACLDGILVALGEGFMPADAVESPWMRARSLRPLLGDRWAAVRASAAWIHGGQTLEPTRHHAQRVSAIRHIVRGTARAQYHEVRLGAADVVTVAGVHVTTPARTLIDLARSGDAAERAVACAWAAEEPRIAAAATLWLRAHPRFPYGRRAVDALRYARGAAEPGDDEQPISRSREMLDGRPGPRVTAIARAGADEDRVAPQEDVTR